MFYQNQPMEGQWDLKPQRYRTRICMEPTTTVPCRAVVIHNTSPFRWDTGKATNRIRRNNIKLIMLYDSTSRQTWPERHGENFCFDGFTAGFCFLRLSQPPLLCEAISHHCDEGACRKLWLIFVRSGEWSGSAKSSKNYNFNSSSPIFGLIFPKFHPVRKFVALPTCHPSHPIGASSDWTRIWCYKGNSKAWQQTNRKGFSLALFTKGQGRGT